MKAEFKDINFKLCAIQELMYNQELLLPKFDINQFVQNYSGRKIDIDQEGYDIIPEALEYFKQLKIPTDLLKNISEIYQDGGNDIYMNICPFWSGSDDQFNITNTEDVSLFPNLKKMTIFYGEDKSILDKFISLGLDAEYI
ncbi:hypothetical protein A3I99_03200 [Candidatus Kaiserbacteria bacterium RIFCSPLOWO2_02_FULL_45_11b]|uniref:DUF6892 domain-containing protein n=1 Tax=Candidatus Kaiserbacteria bacterium RIFCSPLOWO2_12_FULL_45_26 TaxID=1798525 RepID=A0A1F6FG04_9BACT|nr:MAG: hypothetical protein A2Z56_01940 [Candidatus Kaiserbacteria bacterium RIFCSPHIGHO2_12_45_16]OGG69862.1 MAG: hypothetical protein A2929_00030 [Candidatus Kaiserbacteria bacterium RIFCSPLOWO2_01_FULL_45_25]OGG80796.1 MAG: hypothetical protein A3I99_03200 [Candidatus Kaiserbacteria bacterium RIFCSPLOWO2_02_FULL_45_11b]OGG84794.1 MAG: hypothetical protein A3G90_01790 [Candidatus Kaiserbacteria bacterium RIFCSPLOWO2_12_FULL_45_26]